jgi:uncharacterized membrane protein YgcG
MSARHWRLWWAGIALPLLLLLAASFGPTALAAVPGVISEGCAGPVAGQRVYDCAQLLTAAERADLEAQAAAVAAAGAPTVVYLQVRDATAQQTLQDAIDLMGRWNVESHPGARDGFVMFFNLRPGNLRHGHVALYAGQKHYQHGHLPQAELDRIRTDVMTPLLQNEQTAAGISAGLQMVAHDLLYGPPPPPAYQTAASALGRWPIGALSVALLGVVGWLLLRARRRAPLSGASDGVGVGALAAPGDLPPAVAGALIKGRVTDAQVEATILDFGRRGLLVMEPEGTSKAHVRLLGDDKGMSEYERTVWSGLLAYADPSTRIVPSAGLGEQRKGWSWAKDLLRRELMERGWFDPAGAALRRRPLYIAGTLGMVGCAVALLLMLLSREGWAAIGLFCCLGAGLAAFIGGYAIPNTTVEGELAAAPWRGYRESVAARSYEPNLDADLPYIVALGLVAALSPRLKAASERGFAPSWFQAVGEQRTPATAFYPYWIALHTSMAPPSASGGSASGGFAGGGAAGGGGGSAGGF